MLSVGHVSRGDTGVTAVYFGPAGAVAGVDVRGGGPGTRETDLLAPHNTVQRVHAIVLAGGSAFGLAAADGAMRQLAQEGLGFAVFGEDKPGPRVPIVPAAVIFDLAVGPTLPTADDGAAAIRAALAGDDPAQGSVGAGCGATAGKLRGGLGRAQLGSADTGYHVGAIVAANPVGQVVDAATGLLFGAPGSPGIDSAAFAELPDPAAGLNTTIGVVYTNAPLFKAQAKRLALAGHDGIARAVRPAHSPLDGDTLFGVSTAGSGQVAAAYALVGDGVLARLTALAADAVEAAIVSAVCAASDGFGYPAYSSLLR